ncbi:MULTISPECIES: SPL family radical SAM protein [Ruminococcus]|uniref:Radical SAM domain protein n=1 Tax=Ruminococcus albus (strain ATCC 27210 / DSM 20455 / JCM 14654 / NCDO 2250 / 7) TaxID=697329 RepID=E6UIZ2_RUMA7|nr:MULTISPECIES: radical SAM protein [Ruminococcus]ADU22258.1 Radical SAM domain protein [Ruminococcus albus 7 = DSM 20455]MCR5019522.1 radical SAM protein [Ruminococcus sp.]
MEYIKAKTILQKCKDTSWFGNDYNMNLYRGCCHGCIYCDSRSDCYQIEDFDKVRAKDNALMILRDELRRKVKSGVIGTGSMSDPYNPFERDERLTEKSLMIIDAYGFGITVITKSPLITRDIHLYKQIAEHSPVLCKMTITTADDKLSRLVEPRVAASSERFDALARMSDAGVFTGITLMPVLPFIEDTEDNIRTIVRRAHECGVRCIYPAFGMTLRSGNREYFYQKLDESFSGLKDQYIRRYGNRYECPSPNAKKLWQVFTEECVRYGILYEMKAIINAYKAGYEDGQLSFFD